MEWRADEPRMKSTARKAVRPVAGEYGRVPPATELAPRDLLPAMNAAVIEHAARGQNPLPSSDRGHRLGDDAAEAGIADLPASDQSIVTGGLVEGAFGLGVPSCALQ